MNSDDEWKFFAKAAAWFVALLLAAPFALWAFDTYIGWVMRLLTKA